MILADACHLNHVIQNIMTIINQFSHLQDTPIILFRTAILEKID